jgi:prepilin-type N-terminal cleavage/methylation domain-containing protein
MNVVAASNPSQSLARRGLTLLELLIVLFIIAGLIALLAPALGRARESARRSTCESNLRQLSMAMRMYVETNRRAPDPAPAGRLGGWSVALLPFLEQRETAQAILAGPTPLAESLPAIMLCPSAVREPARIPIAHYVMATGFNREVWYLGDAPLDFNVDWLSGPEVTHDVWRTKAGPHNGGSLVTSTDSSVEFRSP